MLTNNEIAKRLRPLVVIKTEKRGNLNKVLEVGDDHLIVQSEAGTRAKRHVTFDEIRRAKTGPSVFTNSVIVRLLAQIIGID